MFLRRCLVLALIFPFGAFGADGTAIAEAMRLAGEGVVAMEAKDFETAIAKLEAAAEVRPDVPRILSNLAAAQAAGEKPVEAVATLDRIAALGLTLPVDRVEEFAALRARKDFAETAKKLAANNRPKGRGDMAFTLPGVTGLIEGIAWREKTGDFYFGDVHARAIWVRAKDGKLRRLTPESEELLGVFGIAIDEANGALWAAMTAVPAMRGFAAEQKGNGALAEIDLATGELRRVVPVPPPARGEAMNAVGDIALAADGTVYLPDSGEPVIWRLPPGGNALEVAVQSPEFVALQGMAITSAGVAVVSDRVNGLLRVELATGAVQRFDGPANTTLVGIDGLAAGKGNFVFAVQAGVNPPRVLRIDFDPSIDTVRSVAVLEAAHFSMAAPTLGCMGPAGDFYFVGNGGWPRFEYSGGEPTPPRAVPIFKTAAVRR